MSDRLLCPFCQQEAYITEWESANSEAYCPHCDITGDLKLWQELITTRKALDAAVGALKSIQEYGAIAMSELQKNGLGGFQKPVSKMQDMAHLAEKQINEITGNNKM